jgi:hypothetical protein
MNRVGRSFSQGVDRPEQLVELLVKERRCRMWAEHGTSELIGGTCNFDSVWVLHLSFDVYS